MNQHDQRRLKDARGLFFLRQFTWLRSFELGKLMWPDILANRQSADRLVRDWLARRLVIARDLPDGAGRALVLATAGVRLLAEQGVVAVSGKDIGKLTHGGGWSPPLTWRHDLLATGIMCELHRLGFVIHPEAELRRSADLGVKIPDGICVRGQQVLWLEVESARKTGPEMRKLAMAICLAATASAPVVAGFKANGALVGYVPGALDERGFALSHQKRVRRAIQLASRTDIDIQWAECSLLGSAGVGAVTFSRERIQADGVARVLQRLDAGGWHPQLDGSVGANYADHRVFVWESDEVWRWSYAVETRDGTPVDAGYAETFDDAKRACATWLAKV
ncbi:hypothetical protein ACSFA0_07010 [Variovorax sp. LT1P1]|uniref:hypothetical protein n=1 Tax=Variovorax sp. LT1P1 TaxID=3443730 RepID=UPI003F4798FE